MQRRAGGVRPAARTSRPASAGSGRRSSTPCAARSATARWASTPSTTLPATTSWPPPTAPTTPARSFRAWSTTAPNTRLVLGGYSQGAAIIDIITAVPPFPAIGFNNPLPPNVPDHVAALAVFGNPPTAKVGLPLTSSAVYGSRAIDLCNGGGPGVHQWRRRPSPPHLQQRRVCNASRDIRRRAAVGSEEVWGCRLGV